MKPALQPRHSHRLRSTDTPRTGPQAHSGSETPATGPWSISERTAGLVFVVSRVALHARAETSPISALPRPVVCERPKQRRQEMPYPCPRCAYGLPRLPMPVAAPKVGARCSICTHPARAAIEIAIRSGMMSLRAIGRAHGMSAQSLIRHRDTHRQLAPPRHLHPPKWLTPDLAAKAGARCSGCGGVLWWWHPQEGLGGCVKCWHPAFDNGRKIHYET